MLRMMMIWSYFLQPPTWVTWSESPAANLKSSSQGAGPPYYVAADENADHAADENDHGAGVIIVMIVIMKMIMVSLKELDHPTPPTP